ncbi:MAG: hypothetical protein ACI4XB_05795, partial [Ruminococcus sp.]
RAKPTGALCAVLPLLCVNMFLLYHKNDKKSSACSHKITVRIFGHDFVGENTKYARIDFSTAGCYNAIMKQ